MEIRGKINITEEQKAEIEAGLQKVDVDHEAAILVYLVLAKDMPCAIECVLKALNKDEQLIYKNVVIKDANENLLIAGFIEKVK